MKHDRENLLASLKNYTQEWDTFLDNQFEECDYDLYRKQIKSEYNKVLDRLPDESSDNIRSELNSTLKNTLLKIKEKEMELSAFKEHVNIKDLLVEDHNVLIQRRKEKLLADIKENLYVPKLKNLSEIGTDKVTDKYKFINNAMYYRKEFVKKLIEYQKVLCNVEIQLSDDFIVKSRVILGHVSFVNIGLDNANEIVNFTIDNVEIFNKHDTYLTNVYSKFQKDYLGL
jgi:hypothetical protein